MVPVGLEDRGWADLAGFQPPEPQKTCDSGTASHFMHLDVQGVVTKGEMRHTEIRERFLEKQCQCDSIQGSTETGIV